MRSIFTILLFSLIISGCSLFGSDEEPAEIMFTVQNFSADELSITTAGTNSGLNISKSDFTGIDDDHFPGSTKSFSTDNDGMMTVSFSFLNESSELSDGEFELELREDWQWSVNFQIGSADYNPLNECFGCQFYESFELNSMALSNQETEADSLYVVLGGNYISEPVMY
ncbi:hypothetical protein [Rhodohalobacter sp.]|uniref:hypothetical protein n=1 Tax=Rhodohalobacter sp. TaxID=1974210 RepID=UPI002ACF06F8|nr:hypothetical protein [Rhodohalobacter sp.]MDZ7755337.1 hypothetical protein [Rhodohalobacter sp.]